MQCYWDLKDVFFIMFLSMFKLYLQEYRADYDFLFSRMQAFYDHNTT